MTAHPQAEILMDIAKEAQVNPEPHKEWQYRGLNGEWLSFGRTDDLAVAAASGAYPMRRKPRAVRVSGEVPEEVIKMARRASDPDGSAITASRVSSDIARALLSLVEES